MSSLHPVKVLSTLNTSVFDVVVGHTLWEGGGLIYAVNCTDSSRSMLCMCKLRLTERPGGRGRERSCVSGWRCREEIAGFGKWGQVEKFSVLDIQ